jgi:hypothetical protein
VCPGEDLNLHPVKDMALNHARLPVPPPGHGYGKNYTFSACCVNPDISPLTAFVYTVTR